MKERYQDFTLDWGGKAGEKRRGLNLNLTYFGVNLLNKKVYG